MKKHLFGAVLLSMALASGFAAAQTIDQIQQYNPTTGAIASPYTGQVVTVSGIVVERFNYSTGSGYIWSAGDGGIAIFGSGGDAVAFGDLTSVTGTVASFGKQPPARSSCPR